LGQGLGLYIILKKMLEANMIYDEISRFQI
jgi:hypothetical protein